MASDGKYFMLVSKLNGHVIGPEGEWHGARLVMSYRNDSDDKLYWFTDPLSGCLRNKKTGLCFNICGDCDVNMETFMQGRPSQHFFVDGHMVKNRADGRVVDIRDNNPNVGASLCVWQYNGGANQQFDYVFQRPRYFMLRGESSGKVLDIVGVNRAPGAKICIYDENRQDNQLWYEDRNGLIRSKLNNFVFDGSCGDITMQPYDPNNRNRHWFLYGSAVALLANPGKVLDVANERRDNGATLCSWDNRNAGHQRWAIIYV